MKHKFIIVFFFISFFLLSAAIFDNPAVRLKGKPVFIGNAPFIQLVLRTEDQGDYEITGKLREEIEKKYLNVTLIIQAEVLDKPIDPGIPGKIRVIRILHSGKAIN